MIDQPELGQGPRLITKIGLHTMFRAKFSSKLASQYLMANLKDNKLFLTNNNTDKFGWRLGYSCAKLLFH